MGTDGGGIRAELDWKAGRHATLGFVGSVSATGMDIWDGNYTEMAHIDLYDVKLLGFGALGTEWGKWRLRATVGAGVVVTAAVVEQAYSSKTATGAFPVGEVGVALSRDLGAKWALAVGPVLSIYLQEFQLQGFGAYGYEVLGREVDTMMYLAARYRL